MISPLPADLVQAILAIHLAMEMEELYEALERYMEELCGISRFSCFLFNNDNRCYSLAYSNVIESTIWDEVVFKEEQAPFKELFGHEPLLSAIHLEWFGNCYDIHWAKKLTINHEVAAAIVFHEYPEDLDNNAISLRFLLSHFTNALIRTTIFCEMRSSKEEQASRLDLINEMGEMLGNKSLEPVLATLMRIALKITRAEVGSIMLYNDTGDLQNSIEWGLNEETLKALHFTTPEPIPYLEKASSSQEIFIETDINHSDQLSFAGQEHRINSIASLPLYTPHENYGLLNVVNLDPDLMIDDLDLETLNTIAKLAATTIENHRLREMTKK